MFSSSFHKIPKVLQTVCVVDGLCESFEEGRFFEQACDSDAILLRSLESSSAAARLADGSTIILQLPISVERERGEPETLKNKDNASGVDVGCPSRHIFNISVQQSCEDIGEARGGSQRQKEDIDRARLTPTTKLFECRRRRFVAAPGCQK